MLPRANFWLKYVLPCVVVLLLALCLGALRTSHQSTLRSYVPLRAGIQGSIMLPWSPSDQPVNEADKSSAAWRLNLRVDAALRRPGPAWLLFEGAKAGEGYELHWQTSGLSLQLFRSGDQALIGSASLEHFPSQVVFSRHGYHLDVLVDGVPALSCVDPLPTPPASSFGLSAAGPMPDSTLSLFDDHLEVDPRTLSGIAIESKDELRSLLNDRDRSDLAILHVRYALGLDPEKAANEVVTALEQAGAAVRRLPADNPDRLRLQHWLAWGEVHLALARQDADAPARTSAAIRQLVDLGESVPVQENLGMLLEVLARISNVCARPPYRAPDEVLRWRRSWFDILTFAASKAEAACTPLHRPGGMASPAIDDVWLWQLRLLVHGAECLRGPPALDSDLATAPAAVEHQVWPRPTPIEAPDWVVIRWRAFAGNDPGGPSFASPIPASPDERNPIRPALDHLIQIAAFEPVAAVMMRARILDALAASPANASQELHRATEQKALDIARSQTVPAREAVLAIALLALRGYGDPATALSELDWDPHHVELKGDGTIPWYRRDALAYALYRLIQHRQAESSSTSASSNPLSKPDDLPEGLGPFTRLLSGKPDATHEAWLTDPQVLPPAQALAAALAMQEVAGPPGTKPQWSLLDQLPCYTLPLALMKRADGPVSALPATGTPSRPPPVVP